MMTKFTSEQVAKGSNEKEGLIIIDKLVYDITNYMDKHPGGDDILAEVLGQDASEAFHDVGHSTEAMEELKSLQVGELEPTQMVATKEVARKSPVSFFALLSAAGVVALSLGAVLFRHQVENPLGHKFSE